MAESRPAALDLERLAREMQATTERLRGLQGEVQDLQANYFDTFVSVLADTVRASGWESRAVVRALRERLEPRAPRSGGWGSRAWRVRADPGCVYLGRGQLPACVLQDMRTQGFDPALRADRDCYRDAFMEPVPDTPQSTGTHR